VKTPLGQYCSMWRAHSGQVRSAPTMQPTPTRVSNLNFFYRAADSGHAAGDFVAGHAGIRRRMLALPFIANGVQVRMADAAEEDFDLHPWAAVLVG
jgi:hypothetical protein